MAARRRASWLGRVAPLALALVLLLPAGSARPGLPASGTESLRTAAGCLACDSVAARSPRPSAASIDWQNVTAERFGDLPPASVGASMVYDIGSGDDLWFGGCASAGCTGNQTWVFANGSWTNDSGDVSTAPPARAWAMEEYLEYIPQEDPLGVPLLVGGNEAGPNGTTVLGNDTWLFQGGSWTREIQRCPCLPALSHGSLAFDPQANVSLLFGGCLLSPRCTNLSAESWGFGAKGSAWGPLNVTGPSARYGAAMAYDPDLQANVLFGGADACGSGTCAGSDTWTYTAVGWTNVTATVGGSTPPPRVSASLIWDAALHEMLLVGGTSAPGGAPANATYALTCTVPGAGCNWTGPVPGVAPGLTGAAAAANPTGVLPMLVGGANASGDVSNATWVYSALPDLNVGISPSRPEVSQPVDLNATAVGSPDPTFAIHWGDGTTETSLTGLVRHVYASAGTYSVEVAVTDPNGSANLHELGVLVVPAPAGSIVVEFPSVDVGVSDDFTATPTLATGVPPFNFSWNFGAPPIEYGPSVKWTFGAPGTVTVVVSMVDSDGLHGSNSTTVEVHAAPSVTIAAQYVAGGTAVAERGVPVALVADVQNGTGPFNLSWDFGDGTHGWGIGPAHEFSTGAATAVVRVSLLDAGGAGASAQRTVRIVPPLSVVRLSETPGTPSTGTVVQFTLDLTGGAGPETFAWSFGDGSGTTGAANVSHAYGSAGTFTANVSVDDGAGGEAEAQIPVTVASSPVAEFGRDVTNPWVAVGLGLIAVGAVAAYLRHRRSRTPPAVASAEPPT